MTQQTSETQLEQKELYRDEVDTMRLAADRLHAGGHELLARQLGCTIATIVLATGQPEEYAPEYFGSCPECGESDGYINVGRNHYFVCHTHKVAWCIGSNLFSAWRLESEEEWRKNQALLETYRVIEEVDAPPATVCPACGAHMEGKHSPWCTVEEPDVWDAVIDGRGV